MKYIIAYKRTNLSHSVVFIGDIYFVLWCLPAKVAILFTNSGCDGVMTSFLCEWPVGNSEYL